MRLSWIWPHFKQIQIWVTSNTKILPIWVIWYLFLVFPIRLYWQFEQERYSTGFKLIHSANSLVTMFTQKFFFFFLISDSFLKFWFTDRLNNCEFKFFPKSSEVCPVFLFQMSCWLADLRVQQLYTFLSNVLQNAVTANRVFAFYKFAKEISGIFCNLQSILR